MWPEQRYLSRHYYHDEVRYKVPMLPAIVTIVPKPVPDPIRFESTLLATRREDESVKFCICRRFLSG